MNDSNTDQELMKERIINACVDALQRYPEMPEDVRQYFAEYVLCGCAGDLPRNEPSPYRWLLPLHPSAIFPEINTHDWSYYLKHYCELSGYKETHHED